MAERGRYRSITTALVNGPDYQRLSVNARITLLTMKVSFGPAGIELKYPKVLAEELRQQTGLTTRHVDAALDELESAKWIRRGGNVVWIVEQLKYEPQLHAANPKHVKGVRVHVLGLPRVPIVTAFKQHYPKYFSETDEKDAVPPIESLPIAYPYPIPESRDSLSKQRERERERDGERERSKPSRPRARKPREPKAAQPTWVQQVYDVWVAKVGGETYGRLGNALKPIVAAFGVPAVLAAVDVYASSDEGPRNGVRNVNYFAQNFAHWHTLATTPLVVDGVLTDRGQRVGVA